MPLLLFVLALNSLLFASDAIPLSQCAIDVLDGSKAGFQAEVSEALTRRGISIDRAATLDSCYKICIELPHRDLCVVPSQSSTWFGRETNLTYQIYEVAKFLRDFHIDLGGRRDAIYGIKEVVLISADPLLGSVGHGGIELQGERLMLKIPSYGGIGYRPLSAQQIRKLWDDGKMFSLLSPMRSRWKYLNPVGSFRVGLRNGLRSAARFGKEKIAMLRNALERGETEAPSVTESIRTLVDLEKIEPDLVEKLRTATPKDLARVLSNWERLITEESLGEGMLDAGLLKGAFESIPRDYTVVMRGVINVGNVHDIGVKIRLGNLKYVRISAGAPQVDVTVNGLINIYTIDNVQVVIDLNRALETASLEEALSLL